MIKIRDIVFATLLLCTWTPAYTFELKAPQGIPPFTDNFGSCLTSHCVPKKLDVDDDRAQQSVVFLKSSEATIAKKRNTLQLSSKIDEINSLFLNPAPGNFGLSVTSPSPTSSVLPGQFNFNVFTAEVNSHLVGAGSPGTTYCACVSVIQSSLAVGEHFDGAEAYGGSFGVVPSGATMTGSDFVGISSGVDEEFISNSRLYGASSGVTVGVNGQSPFELGFETDVALDAAKGTPYRSGFNADNVGPHRATIVDAAFTAMSGVAGGNWQHLMALVTVGGTLNPSLSSGGDFFYSESGITVANFANLPNVTVSGKILNFPGVILGGNGNFIHAGDDLYAAPPEVPSGHVGYGGATTTDTKKCGSLSNSVGCLIINVGRNIRYIPYF